VLVDRQTTKALVLYLPQSPLLVVELGHLVGLKMVVRVVVVAALSVAIAVALALLGKVTAVEVQSTTAQLLVMASVVVVVELVLLAIRLAMVEMVCNPLLLGLLHTEQVVVRERKVTAAHTQVV
jgi:hypothetical protein